MQFVTNFRWKEYRKSIGEWILSFFQINKIRILIIFVICDKFSMEGTSKVHWRVNRCFISLFQINKIRVLIISIAICDKFSMEGTSKVHWRMNPSFFFLFQINKIRVLIIFVISIAICDGRKIFDGRKVHVF